MLGAASGALAGAVSAACVALKLSKYNVTNSEIKLFLSKVFYLCSFDV
jgi:hypothetical protein